MAKTLQEQYNQIKEGKGHKGVFLNDAKRLFPQFITNTTNFDQATTILKQKSVITENMLGFGMVTDASKVSKPDWHKLFEDNLTKNNYDYVDKKKVDNMNGDEFQKGVYFEMEKVRNTITDQNLGELLDKAKDTVSKNLAKNPLYYIENAAFGIDKLGYSQDRPGLTPTEIKGKYKASGYGDESSTIPKKGDPGTGYKPVKENKISFKDLLKD
tara:strand:- start:2078 stop:2716 length:639 start_codon:yes stop_codon:yes gene_type:complete